MRQALDEIANLLTSGRADALTLPWWELRFQHTAAVRSRLSEKYAPATANKMLSALRSVLKTSWKLGLMSAEDYHRAADVGSVKGETLLAGRSITAGELVALMDECSRDSSPSGARDAAIIALLYSCGLRRAELVALDLADYNIEEGTITVRGKRNKQRLAHVVEGARAALEDWLAFRGSEAGPLFLPIRKGGHIQDGRLTTQAIYYILQERAARGKISKELSPHDFRRTFVGDLLDAGADIVTVQKLAGHANVTTTARYDRRPEEAKKKAAQLLHVPYRRRRGA
jgi:site-specific recombinase XerD